MSARTDLLAQLEEEIAQGWPKPYYPLDAAATRPKAERHGLLQAVIDLLADAAVDAWNHTNGVIPIDRKKHAA